MDVITIHYMYRFSDWARDRVLGVAAELTGEQYNLPFDMGPGSVRKTLEHIYGAEWVWLKRWNGHSPKHGECPRDFPEVPVLTDAWNELATERNVFVSTLTNEALEQACTYTTIANPCRRTNLLGHLLLHVVNHGTYHRAQLVNMFKHLGHDAPRLDLMLMDGVVEDG